MIITLIPITRQEKDLLSDLFPNQKFPRTMKQDSKRHHYFCVEVEYLMRPIADTNIHAAAFIEEYDKRARQREKRRKFKHGAR